MAMRIIPILFIIYSSCAVTNAASIEYWKQKGRAEIDKALSDQQYNTNRAKNVIMFIGDGLDLPTITASRILKGQLKGNPGEEDQLSFETFPHVGFSKTYSVDGQVVDSSAAANALFFGVKTKSETLGVADTVTHLDCSTTEENKLESNIMEESIMAGKSAGIVTTSRITHATPAALYAHLASRRWEDDTDIPLQQRSEGCIDIARQLVQETADVKVILGGGRQYFYPNDISDPEYSNRNGNREDGRNLIEEWLASHDNDSTARYVWDKAGFDAIDLAEVDFLLGLFEPGHMKYETEREDDEAGEPSLEEMVEKALQMLQENQNGYFLMAEGGRIDHAHHENNAYKALTDTLAFERAIQKALDMVNLKDTLIIVTSDHAQAMSFVGYTGIGNPIFGLNDKEVDDEGIPWSTLQYTGGPGGAIERDTFRATDSRRDLTNVDTADPDFVQPALFLRPKSPHHGQDVPIYAIGPMAHMVHSTHEESYIAHVMRYAACIGDYENDCSRQAPRRKLRKQD
ncbi:alkaline phosphatase-like [Amphiura filiformis]|uniref:alkaline phosphatase-like n=1 Tax=Amphiura filiformis TaxID=82378 RepID=UPI003B2169EC